MITDIRLQNFRSYQDTSFVFKPGVNVVAGPNASGKTNLLEAILIAAQGKSYRAHDSELVQHGATWARLDVSNGDQQRVVKLEHQVSGVKKSFTIDDKKTTRLVGGKKIPVVLFEPNHLLMLGGSPELRRAFLDALIEQINPEYGPVLNRYKRTLQQRNKLLKTAANAAPGQLFVWDIRLSELGAQIVAERHTMIQHINQQLGDTYSQLARRQHELTLHYDTVEADRYASYLLKKLEHDQQLDLLRGFTGAGPHREDITFLIDQEPLAQTASRGEVRTTLLALKIIELQTIEAATNQKPLLLLDDVFSELDSVRRKALTGHLKDHQVFITTTDADVIGSNFKTFNKVKLT